MPYQFRSMTVAVMVRVLLVTGWIAVSPIAVHATRDWRNEAEWHIRQVMADSRSPGRVLVAKHAVRKMIAGEAVVWGEGLLAKGAAGWTGIPFAYTMRIRLRDRHYRQLQYWVADEDEYFDSMYWEPLHASIRPVLRITCPEWYAITASSHVPLNGTARPMAGVTLRIHARDGRLVTTRSVQSDRTGRWRVTVKLKPGSYRCVALMGKHATEVRFAVRRQTGTWSNEEPGVWRWDNWLTTMRRPFAPAVGLYIDSPRFESHVRGSKVWLRGRARAHEVILSVDHGYERVFHRKVRVHQGRWGVRVPVKRGVHRAIVRAGIPTVECMFTVR